MSVSTPHTPWPLTEFHFGPVGRGQNKRSGGGGNVHAHNCYYRAWPQAGVHHANAPMAHVSLNRAIPYKIFWELIRSTYP